jgi:hypothetical protein
VALALACVTSDDDDDDNNEDKAKVGSGLATMLMARAR